MDTWTNTCGPWCFKLCSIPMLVLISKASGNGEPIDASRFCLANCKRIQRLILNCAVCGLCYVGFTYLYEPMGVSQNIGLPKRLACFIPFKYQKGVHRFEELPHLSKYLDTYLPKSCCPRNSFEALFDENSWVEHVSSIAPS